MNNRPQGAVYQGPLSGIGGQREYHAVSERSSGRYGSLYGPYCQCLQNFGETLSNISTVTSFDILMQNFYKISQGNEKVPSFATRLEGTLNQIRIKCPGRIANHEVPGHLKD